MPISISGLGVRESAFAFFFVMNGLTVEEGISVLLADRRLERYLLGILGGSFLLALVISSRAKAVASASDGSAPAPGP